MSTHVVRKSPSSGLKTGVDASLCYNYAYLNNSTKWEGYLCGEITLFFNPEEGDFLTTRVNCMVVLIVMFIAFFVIVIYLSCSIVMLNLYPPLAK